LEQLEGVAELPQPPSFPSSNHAKPGGGRAGLCAVCQERQGKWARNISLSLPISSLQAAQFITNGEVP